MSEIDADGNVISAGDVEGDENDNGNTNPGDLGRCIVDIGFVRRASKSFTEIRLKRPENDRIVVIMKEIAEVLKSSAEQAGMRSPSDDIDTVALYGKIVDTLDDEALLLLEKLFDVDQGAIGVHEGISRWLRYCLLGDA